MTYIYWLSIFVWLPIIVLWAMNWTYLSRYTRTFLYCVIWSLLFSIPWDIWAVKAQIWIFPQNTNVGLQIGGLPLEEYFFMIFVTILISTVVLLLRKKLALSTHL
jgi:lycopene cyclase domain-containing protein